jgi:hypothetical protein
MSAPRLIDEAEHLVPESMNTTAGLRDLTGNGQCKHNYYRYGGCARKPSKFGHPLQP